MLFAYFSIALEAKFLSEFMIHYSMLLSSLAFIV